MTHKHIATAELSDRILLFMKESLGWCMRESETSTQLVLESIDALLKKTERVASISSESLQALNSLKDAFGRHYADKQTVKSVDHLVNSLESLSKEHREAAVIIGPVIEALQFQDLLRQNLENITKITAAWVDMRRRTGSEAMSRFDVGSTLLKCTSTVAERQVIRQFFPELPPEESIEGQVAMF